MFRLKSEVQLDMAHHLHGYKGKCSNIHGHRYRLVATFAARELHQEGQLRGMVEDFSCIKQALRELETALDHNLLVEDNEEGRRLQKELSAYEVVLVPYRPTAECMAQDIYHRLKAKGLPVDEVELYETPTNSCSYREDETAWR